MDPPHPHTAWTSERHPQVAWWWDTEFGPNGNYRETGPKDDDKRPALLLNTGLTYEQYLTGKFDEYIKEARDVGPEDVWTDAFPETSCIYNRKNCIALCKEDTLPEERDELDRRGFTYLGSRCDSMYFHNPHGMLPEMDWLGRTDITYTVDPIASDVKSVRIIIQRGRCMCSSFHRTYDAFYWSRVAFDGNKPRDPPQRPSPPPPPSHEVLEQQRLEREGRRADLEERAAKGDGGANFFLALLNLREDLQNARNAEVLRIVTEATKLKNLYMKNDE